MNCKDCKYFVRPDYVGYYDGDGECHKHAPIQKSRPSGPQVCQIDGWANVTYMAWCGDFENK